MLGFLKKRAAEARGRENQAFKDKYLHFKELLDRNNEVLETLSNLAEIRDRREWINLARLRAMITRTAVNVYRLIENLNYITDDKLRSLSDIFAKLEERIKKILDAQVIPQLSEHTVPLARIGLELSHEVGAKAATLGEIHNKLGLAVPPCLALTAYSYQSFLESQRLQEQINKENLSLDPGDLASIEEASGRLQEMILASDLPPDLDQALREAYASLQSGGTGQRPVILRSSAVGEDEPGFSFAGLYRSIINPRPQDLAMAYKEVVASKYSARAMTYRLQKGLYEELTPMCALLMELVDAASGGVMFTRDPNDPKGELLIHAVWGLGKLAVDGTVTPDRYRLDREQGLRIVSQELGSQDQSLVLAEEGGVRLVDLHRGLRQRPCLDDQQIHQLAGLGLRLEEMLGAPQDVEWAVDRAGKIYIMQSRALRMEESALQWADLYPEEEISRSSRLIVSGLQIASSGAAAGRPVALSRLSDMNDFVEGAVLVVKTTGPDLVSILPRASAVLSQKGSSTGHLAIIAREFQVPMLVGLPPQAADELTQQDQITVDAFTGSVFQGKVPALLKMAATLREGELETATTPTQRLLEEVLQFITPLNLVNPRDPSFRPQSIRTIHDIIRFSHEKAINAMFDINDARFLKRGLVKKLDSPVPLSIYMIDLGGGLSPNGHKKAVGPQEITSIPMLALYRGMTTPGVRWAGHIPIDFKGFISVFANTMYDAAKYERRLGDRSYAIVSRNYVNFSSRLGYHFSIVDAYIGSQETDNYISFRFKGGAASIEKRSRRVRFIAEVLERNSFWVDQKADLVNARVKRLPKAEMEEKLEMLGRLMGCSRQLDVTMHNDVVVDHYVELFLKGDYSMGHGGDEPREAV